MSGLLRATLTVRTSHAMTILASISPEAGREIPRTKIMTEAGPGQVVLKVEASDLAAMRAALNSYLRWMQIAEEMSITSGE